MSQSSPIYTVHGVIRYAVPNMSGTVPRTSTYALAKAMLPYVTSLANAGLADAVRQDTALRKGINACAGHSA